MSTPATMTDLARLIQAFFCQFLMQQRHASPETVNGYRDTFRLLLHFAERYTGKSITELSLSDLDAPLVLAFLNDLEAQRHNLVRSRDSRQSAPFCIMPPCKNPRHCRGSSKC